MSNPRKTFKIATLGCRTNQYESQAYHDQLAQLGYAPAKESEAAELCIINTCTVTEGADRSSRHEIRQLIRENPGAKVAVTGCYAQRNANALKDIEGITHIVPNLEKDQLVAMLFPDESVPEFSIQRFEAHTRAFVKVQDGCNSFCSYCIIPYVRGRSRSRTIESILEEVKQLVANGYKEIVLTGINIGDFDGDVPRGTPPHRLADLVRAVDAVEGVERLRISSIDPDEVDEDLLSAVIQGKHTCPSMHVVLQAGSNVILKKMNRKYTRQIFLETVERLRKANPHFTFTTDVIVGFPGESEGDFEDTLAVIREVQFAKVHMFPYSERPGTRAVQFPQKVPEKIIQQRKQIVLREAEHAAFELRERFVGLEMKVLTEARDSYSPEWITGHTENFLPVQIHSGTLQSNQIVNVKLLENTPKGLVGQIIQAEASHAHRNCGAA